MVPAFNRISGLKQGLDRLAAEMYKKQQQQQQKAHVQSTRNYCLSLLSELTMKSSGYARFKFVACLSS